MPLAIPLYTCLYIDVFYYLCNALSACKKSLIFLGGNVLLLNLYGKNSEAQMQGLHAMFGLGAFVSPLLLSPFLTTTNPDTMRNNLTNANLTNASLTNMTDKLNGTDLPSNITQNPHIADHSSLRYPYIISMLFFVIPIVTFAGASFKDSGLKQQRDAQRETSQNSEHRVYRGFTLVLLFLFLLLYVGLEVAIGGLIFSFSFQHGILKSKSVAALLTSTFWGSFCVGRFLSIPLSVYVRAYRILVMDLLGCVIGSSILVFLAPSVHAWLWVGTSIVGLSMAAVFPSTMSWAETFMHISGKTASILVVGASLGEMTIPFTIGTLMQHKGADVFVESVFVVIVLAIIVFGLASCLARRQRKEQTDDFRFHFHKGAERSNNSMFSKPKGDEVIQLLEDSSEIFSVDN